MDPADTWEAKHRHEYDRNRWANSDKEAVYERRRRVQFPQKYGITLEDYEVMLDAQNGVCAICKQALNPDHRKKRLSVDHNHATGKVRGLLCQFCNMLVSWLEDGSGRAEAAKTYLEENC